MAISGRSTLAFADESKQGAYILAVFVIPMAEYGRARAKLWSLAQAIGRTPPHFHSLRPAQRNQVMKFLAEEFPKSVTLHISGARYSSSARQHCIESAINQLAAFNIDRFVLEQDRTIEKLDRSTIHSALSRSGHLGALEYGHADARNEPCLWVPDAVAWCWQRGGQMKETARPVIADVIDS